MSCVFEAQMQQILLTALQVELNQPWGSGPCRGRLALFALSGKEDPLRKQKLHRSGSPASGNVDISWSADCSFKKRRVVKKRLM